MMWHPELNQKGGRQDLAIPAAPTSSRAQLWKKAGVRTHVTISPCARQWKYLAALASAGVVAVALISPGAMAATTPTAPPVTTASGSPSEAVQLFASEVETLGVEHYPSTFAGATLEPTGVTDVYAVVASDAKLVSAIEALNTQGYPVKVVGVTRSYSQLNALSAALGQAYSHLKTEGINLSQWGPDPSSGSLEVTLQKPTASDISALASSVGTSVTSSNYGNEASDLLKRQVGTGIMVQSQYAEGSWVAAGRTNDTAPFYGGDQIYGPSTCTGGFNMIGNVSGHAFMYTAGHCGSGTWVTGAQEIGKTSTNYLTPTSGKDFQSIYLSGGGLGIVWTNGSNLLPVSGRVAPAVGVNITFNGSVTGEVRYNPVIATGVTQCGIWNSVGGFYYCASHQVIASNPNGTWICRPGDSGGPVYKHSGSDVVAVGIITAYMSVNGANGGSTCMATAIGYLANVTDTTLITS